MGKTATVIIKFFAVLRDITGRREQKLELRKKDATVSEILDDLSREYGKNFRDYVFETGSRKCIKSQISIMINGQSLRNPESLNTRVRDGDTMAILPPISGG